MLVRACERRVRFPHQRYRSAVVQHLGPNIHEDNAFTGVTQRPPTASKNDVRLALFLLGNHTETQILLPDWFRIETVSPQPPFLGFANLQVRPK